MKRQYIIIVMTLVLVFSLIAVGTSYKKNAPVPPTPTPTQIPPTPLPGPVNVKGLGGPMLNDPEIRAILAQPWKDENGVTWPAVIPDASLANTSSSKMNSWGADPSQNKPADYTGIDFVWQGDSYYANQFRPMNPNVKVLETKEVFRTKLMLFTWWKHLDAFIQAGYFVKVDDHYEIPLDKACKLAELQVLAYEGKLTDPSWGGAGINLDPRYIHNEIDINGSSYGSSTGIEQMAWMANCFANNGANPTVISQVPGIMNQLTDYVWSQGGQAGSLSSFAEFLSSGEGMVAFIGYDSAFPTTANEQGFSPELISCISKSPDDPKAGNCPKSNRVIGGYIGGGTVANHTYLALTPNGQLLLKRLSDPRIVKIAWAKLGMTTPAMYEYPAPISWMSTSVPIGSKPRDDVYTAILQGLDAVFLPKK